MKKMKSILAVILIVMMSLAATACGNSKPAETTPEKPAESAKAEPIVWDYLDLDSASHPMVLLLKEWSDEIYKKTDGQLKINIRVGGELPFTTAEYLDAVSSGSVQMAGCMISAISSYLEAGGLPGCPYMTTDIDSFNKVMGVLDKYLDTEMAEYGVSNPMTLFYPTQDVYGTGKLPAKYTDLKGLKIRTSGAEQAKFWKAVGLVPTSIDASEVSSALNTNVINGLTTATMAVDTNKWYESLDWVYMCNSMIIPVYTVVNNDAYNKLPADVKGVFDSVTAEFAKTFPQRMQDYSDKSLKALEGYGIKVVTASAEDKAKLREIAVPLWNDYAKNAGENAAKALTEIKTVLGIK